MFANSKVEIFFSSTLIVLKFTIVYGTNLKENRWVSSLPESEPVSVAQKNAKYY